MEEERGAGEVRWAAEPWTGSALLGAMLRNRGDVASEVRCSEGGRAGEGEKLPVDVHGGEPEGEEGGEKAGGKSSAGPDASEHAAATTCSRDHEGASSRITLIPPSVTLTAKVLGIVWYIIAHILTDEEFAAVSIAMLLMWGCWELYWNRRWKREELAVTRAMDEVEEGQRSSRDASGAAASAAGAEALQNLCKVTVHAALPSCSFLGLCHFAILLSHLSIVPHQCISEQPKPRKGDSVFL